MENKISASTLTAMVALATGQPGDLCEKFVNELILLVSDTLEAGENVRIKGLGTFKLVEIDSRKSVDVATGEEIEIPAHRRVIFVPCKELASIVNAPFEAFEAEEVADDLPTDELMLDPEDEELDTLEEEDDSENDDLPVRQEEEPAHRDEEPTGQIAARQIEEPSAQIEEEDTPHEDTIVFGEESIIDEKAIEEAEQAAKEQARVIRFGERAPGGGDQVEDRTSVHVEDEESVSQVEEGNAGTKSIASTESIPEESFKSEDSFTTEDSKETAVYDAASPLSHSDTDDSEIVELTEEEEGVNYAQAASVEVPRRGRFGKGFLLGFLTAAVVIALLLLVGIRYGYISPEKIHSHLAKKSNMEVVDKTVAPDPVAGEVPDSAAGDDGEDNGVAQPADTTDTSGVPTRPSDEAKSPQAGEQKPQQSSEPKYDTVSTTRYLTTMAQEHYGNYNLWPIIYKENQAILGHPDRIKPGTRVVVPPLSKYNIDPEKPEDVAAMKREGVAIYAKFKKK